MRKKALGRVHNGSLVYTGTRRASRTIRKVGTRCRNRIVRATQRLLLGTGAIRSVIGQEWRWTRWRKGCSASTLRSARAGGLGQHDLTAWRSFRFRRRTFLFRQSFLYYTGRIVTTG